MTRRAALINTPLQRGEGCRRESGNRFNGLARPGETVETVSALFGLRGTPLKRSVNETRPAEVTANQSK
jgi:hypothetical protein